MMVARFCRLALGLHGLPLWASLPVAEPIGEGLVSGWDWWLWDISATALRLIPMPFLGVGVGLAGMLRDCCMESVPFERGLGAETG